MTGRAPPAIETAATGRYAGEIGFADFRREIAPAMRGRTVCTIQPANAASLRVAERCGYVAFGEGDVGGSRVRLLERRPG